MESCLRLFLRAVVVDGTCDGPRVAGLEGGEIDTRIYLTPCFS